MANDLKELTDFANEVRDLLLGKYDDVEVQKVVKNHDEILVGVTVRTKNNRVSPNVYLNDYYRRYMDNRMSIQDVSVEVQRIVDENTKDAMAANIDPFVFLNKSELLKRVIVKLTGTDNNEQYLSNCVYVPVADGLVAVLHVFVSISDKGIYTSKLTKDMLDVIGLPLEAVYEIAKRNTQMKFPYSVRSLASWIKRMCGEDAVEKINIDDKVYIITNIVGINGASVILYDDVLKAFCEEHRCDRVYILPSSIHELFLIPEDAFVDKTGMLEIVRSANKTLQDSGSYLSDDVFMYDASSNKISNITK